MSTPTGRHAAADDSDRVDPHPDRLGAHRAVFRRPGSVPWPVLAEQLARERSRR